MKMLEHCAQLAGLRGGERILDVGCGHGGTLIHFARRNCQGTGLTLSPKQARIAAEVTAKAGLDGRLKFIVDDVDRFTFPQSEFDLVWAMESSEHFANKPRFLQNVASALKPNGRFLLAAWTGSMQSARVREVARVFLCPALWTAGQYSQAAETAGLRVDHCEDLTAGVVRTWEICREHARTARAVVKLLPQAARDFVEGIDIILDAYRSGDLSYTVLAAGKPSP